MLTALLLGLVFVVPQISAPERDVITVRVYDAAGLSAAERREAQQVGGQLLAAVGIHVEWTACGVANAESDANACSDPPADHELIVRLVRGPSASPSVLGFAYVPGVVATALVDEIQETARRNKQLTTYLLGAVMAHELTHLILGSHGHTHRGLMRAAWSDQDIRLGRIWKINLTGEERRALAAGLHAKANHVRG
jgi:hypothetical protein